MNLIIINKVDGFKRSGISRINNTGKIFYALTGIPGRGQKRGTMTSKQRSYLKGLAMKLDPIFQIGKSSLTPEFTKGIDEALEARELIKISILKNCLDDPREMAQTLAEHTRSEVVQIIGKKIVLYRESREKKRIELPK